jgi:hypothetical protein
MPTRSSRRSRVRTKKGGRRRRSRVRTKKGGRRRRSRVRTKKGGGLRGFFRSRPQSPLGASRTTARKQAEKNNRTQRRLDAEVLRAAKKNKQDKYNTNTKKLELKHKISTNLYNSLKNNPVIWNFILKNQNIKDDLQKYIFNERDEYDKDYVERASQYYIDNNTRTRMMTSLKKIRLPLSKRNPLARSWGRRQVGVAAIREQEEKWNKQKIYDSATPRMMSGPPESAVYQD